MSEWNDILLVEDNSQSIELTMHALKKTHLVNPIQIARNGAEALDYVFCQGTYAARKADAPPALILLDLKLPRVSGLEVLRRLRADDRTRSIPVIILSASREERDILQGYQFGADGYLVKPIDLDKLNQTLREVGLPWALLNRMPQ